MIVKIVILAGCLIALTMGFTHPPYECYECTGAEECQKDLFDMKTQDWGGEIMFPKSERGTKFNPLCFMAFKLGDPNTVTVRSGGRENHHTEQPQDYCMVSEREQEEVCTCYSDSRCNGGAPSCKLRKQSGAQGC